MKCINKFIFLLESIFLVFLLVACGNNSYDIPYDISNTSIGITHLSIPSFASDFCITNTDIKGTITTDFTDIGAVGLFDLSHKDVLYAQNIHNKMYPASLTKIMTAIVALKYGDLDQIIHVNEPIVFQESGVVTTGIVEGDSLTLSQALHLLLIESSNDAAIAIAREIGGSIVGFSDLMNKEALELGATNSHFSNPHGLYEEDHYTTAYDLYLIFQEAITYDIFNEIILIPEYETTVTDKNGDSKIFSCTTTSQFLKGYYEAPSNITVLGGKTGTTNESGHCLILHTTDDLGQSYISIMLNSPYRDYINEMMAELLGEI